MTHHVQVAVIGGGIVGASVLYHLARLGRTDCVLIEKNELTAGATWHAAGNTPSASGSLLMSRFQAYSIDLYARLEQETGQPTGLHKPGSLSLASHPDRMDEYRRQVARGKTIGLHYEVLGADECKSMVPLMNTRGVLGAIYDPLHGHVDPSSATQAMAKGARASGATILRQQKVIELTPTATGGWRIKTPDALVEAEVIVNCAGMWAPEIARLAGADLPVVPILHQYVVTDAIDEIAALDAELPVIRDRDHTFYMRQERSGLIVGPYERQAVAWNTHGIPPEFGQELLQPDLDRIEEGLLAAAERMPVFGEAGIARVVNGPISYTPDERPLIGPMPGQRNHWVCAGTAVGIVQGGGMGQYLAEWLIEGSPAWDPGPVHPARFDSYATVEYTVARALESYTVHHMVPYPGLEHPAGRPARTTALYDLLGDEGAVWGAVNGWERPLWFAPRGVEAVDSVSLRRPGWFEHVADEALACRRSVALFDMSIFAKYEISGPGARDWIERVFTSRAPAPGRALVTLMCTGKGGILGDFLLAALAEDHFYVVGAGGGEGMHLDLMQRALPAQGVRLQRVTTQLGTLHVAGPDSRALLSELTRDDLSNEAMPFLSARDVPFDVGPARLIRISFSGDLGYEIHVPVEMQCALYRRIREVGARFDLRLAGSRALQSLRIEKGYLMWGSDLTTEVDPYQAGLGFMVHPAKNADFIGSDALERIRAEGPSHRLRLLDVDGGETDCLGGEPIFSDGALVGQTTSGGYGHFCGKSLAVGWIEADACDAVTRYEIGLFGDRVPAVALEKAPFDPDDTRLRA